MENLNPLVREIKAEMERQSISQKALADRLGVHPAYVNKIVLGHKTPGADTLERIAESLGMRWTMKKT